MQLSLSLAQRRDEAPEHVSPTTAQPGAATQVQAPTPAPPVQAWCVPQLDVWST